MKMGIILVFDGWSNIEAYGYVPDELRGPLHSVPQPIPMGMNLGHFLQFC
jgi:hypothetical protein